jgi:hypothetical protein
MFVLSNVCKYCSCQPNLTPQEAQEVRFWTVSLPAQLVQLAQPCKSPPPSFSSLPERSTTGGIREVVRQERSLHNEQQQAPPQVSHYLVIRKEMQLARPVKRQSKQVSSTFMELAICLPQLSSSTEEPLAQQVHAYLPMKDYGLRFSLNVS